jgi:hypothetical protein
MFRGSEEIQRRFSNGMPISNCQRQKRAVVFLPAANSPETRLAGPYGLGGLLGPKTDQDGSAGVDQFVSYIAPLRFTQALSLHTMI